MISVYIIYRIHTLGLKYRSETHPDSRAVMFEPTRYNKRKIANLLLALGGFQKCVELVHLFQKAKFPQSRYVCVYLFFLYILRCQLLYQCFGDDFPQIDDDLQHFKACL